MKKFDIVIIGSGLGGLLSAVILAKEGFKVCIVEQNKQIGGCLQTFSFDKKVFDSCVHYIGAMEEGQTQNRIFKFVDILDDLKLIKLDENGFDQVTFDDNPILFPHAQGLTNFKEQLLNFFPEDEDALKQYVSLLEKTTKSFPMYHLKTGADSQKDWVINWKLNQTLQSLTKNKKLRDVLLGNSFLYAGENENTPFYIHALIMKSYIDSAYKCSGGSSQISKLLWKKLQQYGGEIIRNEKVNYLNVDSGKVQFLKTEDGLNIFAKQFIANVHPQKVLEWIDSPLLKPIYRKRIKEAENSTSAFMVNIVFKPKTVFYKNHNIYWNCSEQLGLKIKESKKWPLNYALYFTEDQVHKGYAESMSVLTYMNPEETELWSKSENRTAKPQERPESYLEFKELKASVLFQKVAERYPELISNIQSYKIATPLTLKDYMGSTDGSMYGIMADVNHLNQSRILVNTKIPNLFLTGQNVGIHGILGVSVTSIQTCKAILGDDYLMDKISKV